MFVPEGLNNKLWHIPFNRVNDELVIDMVKSNANAYYRYEYQVQGGGATLPDYAIEYYIKLYTRDRNTLRASFGLYRAWDFHMAQNGARQATALTIPVLGIGGVNSWGTPRRRGHGARRARRADRRHPRRRPLGRRAEPHGPARRARRRSWPRTARPPEPTGAQHDPLARTQRARSAGPGDHTPGHRARPGRDGARQRHNLERQP